MNKQMYNRFIWLFVWALIFFTAAIRTTYGMPEPVRRTGAARQPQWGFYAHQQINRLAIFTLPADMMPFFKKHSQYLIDNAVNPDKRRYAVVGEAPRHFIDLDAYPDTSAVTLPRFYKDATDRYGPDTLALHGLVPWQIQLTKYQLTEAFRQQNVRQILRIAADLGHYIADANVPLHTTHNYNGQLTGQQGIHGFWESRLPELFSKDYDFLVGSAEYVTSPQRRAWQAVFGANAALDSVLRMERELTGEIGETRKFGFDERNGITTKVYAADFSQRYHDRLSGQVERQMRASVKMVGDFWFTCWVDAGQPDMAKLAKRELSSDENLVEVEEQKSWLKRLFSARDEN